MLDSLERISADRQGRREFVSKAFGSTSPYQQGLLATGRNCDICASLDALAKMRAYRLFAHRMLSEIRTQVRANQETIVKLNRSLIRQLGRGGPLEQSEHYGKYKVIMVIGAFVAPWYTFTAAVTETGFNLYDHYYIKMPLANSMKRNIKRNSEFLDANLISLIYWNRNAKALDHQMEELLERIWKQCLKDRCSAGEPGSSSGR